MAAAKSRIAEILAKHEDDLGARWMKALRSAGSGNDSRIGEAQLRDQA